MDLTLEKGGQFFNVTPNILDIELKTLGDEGGSFATLSCESGFIQTAGNLKDGFHLEYKNAVGYLYRSGKEDFSLQQIIDVFQQYLSEDQKWKYEVEWKFVEDFGPDKIPAKVKMLEFIKKLFKT